MVIFHSYVSLPEGSSKMQFSARPVHLHAQPTLTLFRTQRSALVEELLALNPAAGVLCNRRSARVCGVCYELGIWLCQFISPLNHQIINYISFISPYITIFYITIFYTTIESPDNYISFISPFFYITIESPFILVNMKVYAMLCHIPFVDAAGMWWTRMPGTESSSPHDHGFVWGC
jgi:hypothetical protein